LEVKTLPFRLFVRTSGSYFKRIKQLKRAEALRRWQFRH